jgi:HD-like signal output (HDOD) protein
MKRRILFVDDEPSILKGLQRNLRPLRKEWEMAFEAGGTNALARLEKDPFDVIISDLRMPDMDGGQLLGQVQEKFPKMVRIILSGHADRKLAMRAVTAAHQFLSKPCEKPVLVSAVNRACSLRDLMNKKAVENVVTAMGTMPSLPEVYTRIMDAVTSDNTSVAMVGEIISEDIGMTAKVLQLVNSSFFAMPRHVATPSEAAVILGIDVLKTLVLTLEVFSAYKKSTMDILSIGKVHAHCINTGILAQTIARIEKRDKTVTDNAMIAGVLHDLGRLILADRFPDEYKNIMDRVRQEGCRVHEAEAEVLGVSHAQIGGYLLGLWGFPDNIVEGVVYHHNPLDCITDTFDLCGMVHIANIMEYYERRMPGRWEQLEGLDKAYINQFGLSRRIHLWRDQLPSGLRG